MADLTFPLPAVLVGARGIGQRHAEALASIPEFKLVAICDLNEALAHEAAEKFGVKAYTDFGAMLATERPAVVANATPNKAHAPLTIQAAESGAKAICCEKPLAVNLDEARRMVAACQKNGTLLVTNHQRRLREDLLTMKALIDGGALGEIETVRGYCQGDILSDGTHTVDSLLFLLVDPDPLWVLGQLHRTFGSSRREKFEKDAHELGTRFGHVVEAGGFAHLEFPGHCRMELVHGDLVPTGIPYQTYEVVGRKGRLWRRGDSFEPSNLTLCDGQGGDLVSTLDRGGHHFVPGPQGQGPWRTVDVAPLDGPPTIGGWGTNYRLLLESLRSGAPHPLGVANTMRGFEIIMGIYESARLHQKLTFPIQQDRFPLDLMVESGLEVS